MKTKIPGQRSSVELRTWIILMLFLSLITSLTIASENGFIINVKSEGDHVNDRIYAYDDILITISGPRNTNFEIEILDENGVVVKRERGETSYRFGNAYIRLQKFSERSLYSIKLTSDKGDAFETFRVLDLSDVCVNCVTTTTTTSTATSSSLISVPCGGPSTTTTAAIETTATTTMFSEETTTAALDIPSTTNPLEGAAEKVDWAPLGKIRIKGKNKGGGYGVDEDPEFEVEFESAVAGGLSLTTAETIKAYLRDSSGNPTGIEPEINRIGNKYQIKIPRKRSIHPGLYKLVVESESHEEEIWFTWGLITVNTNKSIYRPNETAQIFIVVLDKNGYPVSGANISLRVAGPDGGTVYFPSDGGIRQVKRGIYEALYRPALEGNYDLHAEVRGYELNSSIESTFQVRNFYEFDILRINPLMIDPWKGPFSSRIRLISHINYPNFTFREILPSDLEIVSTDADSVSHNGDGYILTWSNLENNSELSYTLRPPLKSPHLYKLGPAEIEYGKELFREPRYWLMASDPSTEINVSAAQGTGTGVLPDTLQADDDSFYEVDRDENVHVTGFNVTGFTGTITSVRLYVRYYVEDNEFGGNNYLNYSLNNGTSWNETTIQPSLSDLSEVERSYEIPDPLTWDDLRYLDVRYDNNDFAQPEWVRFDRIWLLVEYSPPPPTATTWNLSVSGGTIILRGNTVKAYALWDTNISLAYIEHNGSGSFTNYTISGPYSGNWTNHSINTSNATQFPLAGPVYVKLWARDNYNQWNDTSPLRYFILWGLASVVNSSLNPDTIEQGNSTIMRCRVADSNTSQPIEGYNVSFYNGTSFMGVNQTNATGWASWTFTDNTTGLENITCNITDHAPLYYNASSENEKVEVLDTQPIGSDVISPTITDISATPQNVGVGNTVTIEANVTDNVAVDTVYVNISYGGNMYQYPMVNISGDIYEYNFTVWDNEDYTYFIWANDTSGNDRKSSSNYFYAHASVTIDVNVEHDLYSLNENVNLTNATMQRTVPIDFDIWVGDDDSNASSPNIVQVGEVPISNHTPELNVSSATGDGAGSLPGSIQKDDGVFYEVDKDEYLQVTAFNLTSVDTTDKFNSATLYVKFIVQTNLYSGNNYINYTIDGTSWISTTIQPSGSHTMGTEKYDLLENVTNWTDLQNLDVRFDNDDGGGADWVKFNRIWLVVDYTKLTDQRYYLKFDLSSIPSNAKILNASLTYTVASANSGAEGSIYHTNSSFTSTTPPSTIFDDGQPPECSESNPIATINASTAGAKTADVTVSVNETHTANETHIAYFMNETNEDNYFSISGSASSNPPSLSITYETRSQIYSYVSQNITAALLMQVQRNESGSWVTLNTTINQSENISGNGFLYLDDIWNPSAWNTDSEQPGIYRVYVTLRDDDGSILKNDDGSDMEGFDTFEISYLKNIYAQPNLTGHGQNVSIYADVKGMDDVYVNITYPNGTDSLFSMTNISRDTYRRIFNDTWQWGNYTFRVYANKSDGTNATSSDYHFYIRGNASTHISTEKYYYGAFEDVNLLANSTFNNTGGTNISGYISMRIHHWDGGSWINMGPYVVSDLIPPPKTRRDINSGGFINLTPLWNSESWNTSSNTPGLYRVYLEFTSPQGVILKNDSNMNLIGTAEFEIIEANLTLTNLTHENEFLYNVGEYETGDNIAWINVTIRNLNSTAVNASVTLNILDYNTQSVNWGPNETQYCGDLPSLAYCEKRFDNSSGGYLIPLDATPGTYNFTWNVTLKSETSTTRYNTSHHFTLYHLPSNFSSTIDPERIYRGSSSIYNFTFHNPWSDNLTDVNITINCPPAVGFNCTCISPGQSGPTCNFSNVSSHTTITVSFNVSTNTSTPINDYNISVNISYTNPGNESHEWTYQQNQILEVRDPRVILAFDQYPSNITRGGETKNISSWVLNNDTNNHTNVWFNYTLPFGWTNVSGTLNKNFPLMHSNDTNWSNITVSLNLSASLGPQPVKIEVISDEGGWDWDVIYITVYADTLLSVTTNESHPENGSSIKVMARLRYDNGTPISGETITFWNSTGVIGTDTTNASGWASVSYTLPGDAFGSYQFNATYNGSQTLYTNPSENTTTVTLSDKPSITDVQDTPDPQGYNGTVTISANVTDIDGVDTVWANITAPNGSSYWLQMFNHSADIYEVNFTTTWGYGNYSYLIWVNDTAGLESTSSLHYFFIAANVDINIKTEKDIYQPAEWVNLTNVTIALNFSTVYDVYVTKNTTRVDNPATAGIGGKEYAETADSEAISQGENVSGTYTDTHAEGGNHRAIDEVDIDPGGQVDYALQVNYSFSTTIDKSDITAIYFDTDAWSDESIDIDVHNFSSGGYETIGSVHTTENTTRFTICTSTQECDSYVNSTGSVLIMYNDTDKTDNSQTRFYIDYQEIVIEANHKYYLKFDITRVPSNAEIINATLYLTVSSSGSNATGEVYHTNETFNSGTSNATIYNDGRPSECSESNPIDSFDASSTGTKTVGVTTSLNETFNAGKQYIAYIVNETGENDYFEVSGNSGSNPPKLQITYRIRSQASNYGSTDFDAYLTMKVQFLNGTWQNVSDGLIVNNTLVNISSRNYLLLDDLWNPTSWYTDKHLDGKYRVYAELTDKDGNTLKNFGGSNIVGYYEFNISKPQSIIQLKNITVYDVTFASDRKTNTSNTVGSGINTTFDLYTGKVYRVEFHMWNNDSSTGNWSISGDIIHEFLNSTWGINATDEIWYTDYSSNYTGGTWNLGKLDWNTSLGGTIDISAYGVFYYILNITTAVSEKYQVHFMINETQFTLEDYSLYNIIQSESQDPGLYNGIYDLNDTSIVRGQSLLIYARWNEAILSALAEYNTSSSSLGNHTITLPFPNPQNWTNHTITTNSSWVLGNHSAKIYAADLNNNWNTTLPYLTFLVWGQATVNDSLLTNSTILQGENSTMRCRVVSDNGSALSGYNMTFYNSTGGVLGTNLTNASGWASLTFSMNVLGTQELICYIGNYPAIYHLGEVEGRANITVYEDNSPAYYNVSQNASKIHRGENIMFKARWVDDYLLDLAWLESNETGMWQNNSLASPINLIGSEYWSNFSVTIPSNAVLGPMGWQIHANDSFGNMNTTFMNTTVIWGYAIINESSLSPNPIYVNNSTTMRCQVVDYNNGSSINNYNVSFYSNESGYMGTNQTNGTGWASWTFNDTTTGWETITCNITSDPSRYYDPHDPNSASRNLKTALPGADVQAPGAIIYGLNASWIWKGQSLYAYAEWNENISASNITYNTTSSALDVFTTGIVVGNQTNHTITSNSSWVVGIHFVKINASDVWGNWNNTLPYLNFTVWGRSKVGWHSPNVSAYRGTVPLRCRVYDNDSGQGIGGYQVNFWNGSWVLLPGGSVNTNDSGIATYNWDGQNDPVGLKTFYCTISNSGYYNTTTDGTDDETTGNFDLLSVLNVTIDYPLNGKSFHRGETIDLNSTTRDENSVVVTPDSASWYNESWGNITNGEDTTWNIPGGYGLGPAILYINVSKQYYDNDSSNVTIYIWDYSNVTWISPDGGNASQGSEVPLVCQVRDVNGGYGIGNYPVKFYYRNSTESTFTYLDTSSTNSTGHAVYHWNTTGLPIDNYTTLCNITDNSTLYYNVTADNEANTTIELITTGGVLEVYLMLPPSIPGKGDAELNGGYKVGQNKTFIISANVTCRNANCGNVQGTVRYNSTPGDPDTAINTTSDTPFYIVDIPVQNPKSCGALTVNQTCILNWTINSTGTLGSFWKIDVLFTATGAASNNTNYTVIEITRVMIMILSGNLIDFGTVFPGDTCNASLTNPLTITLHNNSNDADGIYLQGTNLVNGSDAIGVRNITWCKCVFCATGDNLTDYWQLIQANVSSGTDIDTNYWIDVPPVPTKGYQGTLYIMANATGT